MRSKTVRSSAVAAATAVLVAAVAYGDGDVQRAAPPALRDDVPSEPGETATGLAAATTQYSHGDPTDEEQWFLELMNRARANPPAEADRILVDYDYERVTDAVEFFFKLKRTDGAVEYTRQQNHDAFEALPAVPPFAFVPELILATRAHSEVMKATDEQTHQAVGEPALRDRVNATGYAWNRLGESVFAFADDMLHAHAGFAIDYGQPLDDDTGLPATGHRDSLMEVDFVTVGVGVVQDSARNNAVGPKLITIDFASPASLTTRYVTGVVYEDINRNLMYDMGEGIPGVRIETDVSDFFAISSASGGYAIPVDAGSGPAVVTATGTPGTAGEVVGQQQANITVGADNVKVDFGPPPEPTPPVVTTLAGSTNVAIGDGVTTQTTIVVPELDEDVTTVGDVGVTLALAHGDRRELTLTLVGPTGVEVVLFDGGPGGADLRGTFDATLHSHESLGAFVGTPSQGNWILRIEDAAGGVVDGILESWALHIRPEWVRPIFAASSPLSVTALKVKDSAKAGKDKVILKAVVDAEGNALDPARGGTLRLLDAATGTPYLEVDLLSPAAKRATAEGAVVKAKIAVDGTTSRGSTVVKVSGLDLSGPAPPTTRVELALGDAILTQDVVVSSGKSTGSASDLFFVDAVKSKASSGVGRSSLVKGRFAVPGGLSNVSGTVEISVGTARFRLDAADLTVKGTKRTFASSEGLRKLIVDLGQGTFVVKVDGPHDAKVGGVVHVTLRLGSAFFGDTSVQPYEKGTKTLY